MNKLKTMLCAVFTLMLVSVSSSARADTSNFAGPYIGVSVSGYGMQLSGSSNAGVGEGTDEVSIGQVAPITGFELGYVIPLGTAFLIDAGASMYSGEATLEFHDDNGANVGGPDTELGPKDVKFTVDDLTNIYIAPTVVLSDTSSLYIKVGLTEADVNTSGDVTAPGDLSGTSWSMGTRTVLESGVFIKTEAGYTEYNSISAIGKGANIDSTNSYSAEPTVAFGTVSLGFRF